MLDFKLVYCPQGGIIGDYVRVYQHESEALTICGIKVTAQRQDQLPNTYNDDIHRFFTWNTKGNNWCNLCTYNDEALTNNANSDTYNIYELQTGETPNYVKKR